MGGPDAGAGGGGRYDVERVALVSDERLDYVRMLLARRRLDLATDDELAELAAWEHAHAELLDELARVRWRP
jgi:hypothetical protein